MTATFDPTVRGAPTRTLGSPVAFGDDHLYLLKLCLELQLEALLLTLGSSAAIAPGEEHADLPWEKWLAEDLDLACALTRDCIKDGIPLPSTLGVVEARGGRIVDSLAARYSAMAAVVTEMMERTNPHRHAAVARLAETRARCEERLDALLGESPESAAERLFPSAEAGHYLG